MLFGVCGDLKMAAAAAAASFDYMEWSVGAAMRPREPREVFEETLRGIREMELPLLALNCFVPGDLKITGPSVNPVELKEYVDVTCERAEQAGVETIVFGSGEARRIPEGFDPGVAHDQLVSFGAMVAPIALEHGVTIAVEPLNRKECNVLNTVAECAAFVREVSHPGMRLLVDAYHLLRDNDSCEDILGAADLLEHVHIATIPGRVAPGAESCDFGPFFQALARAGYHGRVSIESKITDPAVDLPRAIVLMRELEAEGHRQAAQ